MNYKSLNGSVLTYLGDSYYEHEIRNYLVKQGITKLNNLHQEAVKYTSGVAQAKIVYYYLSENLLTEEELAIYKRGRNISAGSKKHLEIDVINASNGFEALIGYLSINDTFRAKQLINQGITYIKGTDGTTK